MQVEKKQCPEAKNVLMYFAGWGSTPEAVSHLSLPPATDYYAYFDYRQVQAELLPSFSQYEKVYAVGWSMGVWAITVLRPYLPKETFMVAMCGTPFAKHDTWGIPVEIYNKTLENLDEMNRERFNRRMCGGKSLTALYSGFSARPTAELKEELMAVGEDQAQLIADLPKSMRPLTSPSAFHHAWVPDKDLVMPTQNQIAYWQKLGVPFHLLERTGHYPFHRFESWSQILSPKETCLKS